MGPVSNDGPGQHNPDRSEGPWGMAVLVQVAGSDTVRRETAHPGECEARKPTALAPLAHCRKTPCERPALEPYWGKPTVRKCVQLKAGVFNGKKVPSRQEPEAW